MRDETAAINLQNIVDTIEIPIYFCMGKHDLTVPSQPTWDFYQNLEAKEKHWVWFEESAHSPLFEESDKFLDLVVTETQKIIKKNGLRAAFGWIMLAKAFFPFLFLAPLVPGRLEAPRCAGLLLQQSYAKPQRNTISRCVLYFVFLFPIYNTRHRPKG